VTSEDALRVAATIREFVLARFPAVRALTLSDEESLLDAQVIDSLGVLDVVVFLEDAFGIHVADDELNAANFDSVGALVRFVLRKR